MGVRLGLVLGCLLGASIASPALAEVMVLPVDGTNLEPGDVDAIWQLVAQAYQGERRETVLPKEQTRAAIEDAGSYPAAAQKLGASEYVYVSAVRLHQKIVITGSLYASDGKLLHSAKMSATGFDDLELVSERLARALVRRENAKKTQEIDTVTKTESIRPNRTWIEKVHGFKVAVAYPYVHKESIAPTLSLGWNGRFESTNYFLEFGVGFMVPANDEKRWDYAYGGLYSELGASLYLTKSSISPYVGVGAMPRLASRSVANVALYAQTGLMFFRESSTRFYTDFRLGQNVLPVGFGSLFGEEMKKLYPTEFALQLGVGF